ncbi:hypothetical protein PB01_17135 [Psychrobacillus glaciei]|uniref:Uncharacterized protein n=1 Tax=Psychrobacillus glaciei TaxID=2283160 RepID=A0A5J6SQV6_9BACI|nr:4'-phosphopantetheinyl transferase superfamily protein [Psychrobacillus glaciei]QFG00389.1 hypothetical protein PB01_17135 [Psychrobacillus glaciei]
MHLIAIKTTQNKTDFEGLLDLIPKEKLEEINRKKSYRDYKNSILGYLGICFILHHFYGKDILKLEFFYNKNGKPFLKNSSLNFNLSHSENWIFCAVGNEIVGVDVEKMNPISFELLISNFSEEEKTVFDKVLVEEKLPLFYEIWVIKECYSKAIGTGLTDELLQTNTYKYLKTDYPRIEILEIDEEYKFSICVLSRRINYSLTKVDESTILELLKR